MKVTLNEAVKLTKQHNVETNVQYTFPLNTTPKEVLEGTLKQLQNNPEMYNVGISHPLITMEKFQRSMTITNYYIKNRKEWNEKGLWVDWSPALNSLLFFRTREQMIEFLSHKVDDNLTFMDFSFNNVKTITLYTGAVELEYHKHLPKGIVYFDEIEESD